VAASGWLVDEGQVRPAAGDYDTLAGLELDCWSLKAYRQPLEFKGNDTFRHADRGIYRFACIGVTYVDMNRRFFGCCLVASKGPL
jgi:hypothetical protein